MANSLIKTTSLYTLGNFLPKAAGIILLPIYTRYLTTSEYGVVSSMQSLIPILVILFSLGFDASIFRLYWDYDSKEKRSEFFGTMILSRAIISFLLLALLLVFQNIVGDIYKSIAFNPFYLYIIVTVFFSSFFEIPKKYLMLKERAGVFVSLSVGQFLLHSGLILWFLIAKDGGAAGFLKAGVIASLILLPVYIFFSIKIIRFRIRFSILKNVLSFSLPIMPILLSGWVINLSDRIFIERYFALSDVGIYNLAYKLAGVVLIVISSYHMSYRPLFFKLANTKNQIKAKASIYRYNYLFLLMLSFSVFLIAFFSKEIIYILFSTDYKSAYMLIPLIVVSYFFNGAVGIIDRMIEQSKKITYMMYFAIGAAILNIVLNFLLIPHWGVFGAAYATIITFAFLFFSRYLFAKWFTYFVPIAWRKLLPALGLFVAIFLIFNQFIELENIYYSLLLKIVVVLLMSALIFTRYKKDFQFLLPKRLFNGT